MSMDQNSQDRKQPTTRHKMVKFLLRAPVASGGLVMLAILASVLVYTQAGLLHHPDAPAARQNETTDQPMVATDKPKQSTLSDKDSIEPEPLPVEEPVPAIQPQTKPRQAPKCNQKAKDAAQAIQDKATETEQKLHRESSKRIGKLSRLLGSWGLAPDKMQAEATRHQKALSDIEARYQQALQVAHCSR